MEKPGKNPVDERKQKPGYGGYRQVERARISMTSKNLMNELTWAANTKASDQQLRKSKSPTRVTVYID